MAYTNLDQEGRQYHTKLRPGDVGRYVFLPGDPFRTDLIASFLDNPVLIAHNREHKTWTGTLDGVKVSVTSTGMGCPSAAIAVEELMRVGADTFIRIGTAGPVKDPDDDKKYDGAIVTAAVRDEGTTISYMPIEYPAIADRHVVAALSEAARMHNKNYIEGITHSKDSFFGELDPDSSPVSARLKKRWEAWQRGNVVCSEMECAAIFVISSLRGKRASAIMNWGNMEDTIRIACDAVRLLIKKDSEGYNG
ncbi:MAG: nucleoside phosphorylase [Halanaerobiaceae bacterium]|nr:nucleoside phosphorylase [Halanaerobiaceae bacterium]